MKLIIVLSLAALLFFSCNKINSSIDETIENYSIMANELADSVSLNDYEPLISGSVVRASHYKFTYPTLLAQGPRYFDWISSTGSPANKFHAGIDYAVSNNHRGKPVYAVASGRIASIIKNCYSDHGIGNQVVIEHKMKSGNSIFSLYGHLQGFASGIVTTAYVPKGTIIGYIGQTDNCQNSGNSAGGIVHLHFELKNSNTSGSNPSGYWGYVPKSSSIKSATSRGYVNPVNYFNSNTNLFDDLTLISSLPFFTNKNQPLSAKATIFNPFVQASNADIRLALYSSGVNSIFLGEIQSYLNYNFNYSGSKTINFSKSIVTSPLGNYELRLEVRLPNNGKEWYVLPTLKNNSTIVNPQPFSILN